METSEKERKFAKMRDDALAIYQELYPLIREISEGELGSIEISLSSARKVWGPYLMVRDAIDGHQGYVSNQEGLERLLIALDESIRELRELLSSYQLLTADKEKIKAKEKFKRELKNLEERLVSVKKLLETKEKVPAQSVEKWEEIREKADWTSILKILKISESELEGLNKEEIWQLVREKHQILLKQKEEQMPLNIAFNLAKTLLKDSERNPPHLKPI